MDIETLQLLPQPFPLCLNSIRSDFASRCRRIDEMRPSNNSRLTQVKEQPEYDQDRGHVVVVIVIVAVAAAAALVESFMNVRKPLRLSC